MKKAVICGAGIAARGLPGQVFGLSGYDVIFIDADQSIVECLNADRKYPVKIVSKSGSSEMFVENVRGVDISDAGQAACEIASADIAATAAGEGALPRFAPILASGLQRRWGEGNIEPLDIIVCEDEPNARKRVETLILDYLPRNEHKVFADRVGVIEAVGSRMIASTDEMRAGNPLRVCAEPACELPVDKNGFRGAIPEVQGMLPVSTIGCYAGRKRYMQDMCRALLAYMGLLTGYENIWQAAEDEKLGKIARGALSEAAQALAKKHGVPPEELAAYAGELMLRFDNPQLRDNALGAGRGPLRIIDKAGVLTGAAFLCMSQKVKPACISAGIAAALLYDVKDDEDSRKMRECVRKKGVGKAIERFCQIDQKAQAYWWILEFYRGYKDGALTKKPN